MKAGDVVSDLAAHQSNLTPRDGPQRAALVALPTPAILRALVRGAVATRRRGWMRAWAERLGGGDGPLPIVDLDADARTLHDLLSELRGRGCERLYLIGARDQPGFARELACRWDGAAHLDVGAMAPDLDADLTTRLHAAASSLRVDGVELLGLEDDVDPNEAAARASVRLFARDPARLAGALHGFLPPAALFGTARGNSLREAWLRYWTERGFGEAVRDAALGLDRALEERLRVVGEPAPRPRRARVFIVTGLDGSGKSSHVAALRDAVSSAGAGARVIKLYRQGAFLELANELGARTRRGAPLASFRVSRIVKLVDTLRVWRDDVAPALDECDAVLFDRYTETHRAAASSQLGWDVTGHPLLAPFPRADRAFWLALDPSEALRRLHARDERLSADEHPVGLAGYADAFAALATAPSDVVLDATAPFDDNAARIRAATLPLLPAQRRAVVARAVTKAPAATRSTPIDVVVGGTTGPTLGADIAALATLLRHEVGRVADGVPTSFWIEAYAAQLVLDARTTTAATASIPLWPEALRRVGCFADLHVLDELARLLDAAVDVRHYAPAPAEWLWAALVPAPAARRRLQAEYADALVRVARDRGWPTQEATRPFARVVGAHE